MIIAAAIQNGSLVPTTAPAQAISEAIFDQAPSVTGRLGDRGDSDDLEDFSYGSTALEQPGEGRSCHCRHCCNRGSSKGTFAFGLFLVGAAALFIFLRDNPAPGRRKRRSASELLDDYLTDWTIQVSNAAEAVSKWPDFGWERPEWKEFKSIKRKSISWPVY